jgi:hypothetical protein
MATFLFWLSVIILVILAVVGWLITLAMAEAGASLTDGEPHD